MYAPFGLNGFKTSPGLPGTGFATGNCGAFADFCGEDDDGADLLVATRGVACVGDWLDLREAVRGVGEETATGRPG